MRTLTIVKQSLVLGVFAALSSFSMDGASQKAQGKNAKQPSFEKTQVTLADFQMLISGKKQQELGSQLVAGLSAEEKERLSRKIARLEKEKQKKIEAEKKVNKKNRNNLKEEREKIQRKRINSFGPEDAELKESLFASLLDEANADARLSQRVRDIEQSYLVSVYYSVMDSTSKLEMIALKDDAAIWTPSYAGNVASK
jgi:hypothetical protein